MTYSVAPSRLANLPFLFPSLDEQQRIAAYLDEATEKIDRLMRLRRRQMELLREQRAALIQQAVTRGVNPRAPLKDSGLPWLGQIPKHWVTKRLKYAVDYSRGGLQMGPFGSMLTSVQETETGFKLYGQENTISNDFTTGRRWLSEEKFAELKQYEMHEGDIVLTRKGSIGQCRIVPSGIFQGIIDSDTIRVRLDESCVFPEYMVQAFQESSFIQHQVISQQRGAILGGLNTTAIANLVLLVPPLSEQHEILSHIQQETANLDALHQSYERQLALLAEYRASLIHECVTGQRAV